MELELMEEKIRYYDVVLNSAERCEQTMEAIVPDALPDIGRIIDAEGTVLIRDKEVADGSARVEGTVAVTVIYAPEPEDTVKKLSLNIPFTCNFTSRGITAESALCVSCAPTLVEARALNPRKVLCRVNVVCSGTAYAPAEMSYMTGVEENSQTAELKADEKRAYLCMDVNERTFSLIDELEMQSGRPMIGEILKNRIRLEIDDVKPVGNKVIFKGAAMLTVMYIAADNGEACSADFELPFSQIVELNRSLDEPECEISVMLTGAEITVGEEKRSIGVALYMVAQGTAYKEMEIAPVTDIYSVTNELEPQWGSMTLNSLSDKCTRRVSVREIVEIDETVRNICDSGALVGDVSVKHSGDTAEFSVEVYTTICYINSDGCMRSVNKTITASVETQCPDSATPSATAEIAGECYAIPVAGGAEMRMGIDFHICCVEQSSLDIVTGAKIGEARETSGRASAVLKAVGEGDSLWSLAKHYGATTADIKKVNGLDSDMPVAGRLLLIPKKRGK